MSRSDLAASTGDTPISLYPRYLTPAAAAAVAEAEAAARIPYTLTERGESFALEQEPRSVRDAWDAHLRRQREAEPEPEAGL